MSGYTTGAASRVLQGWDHDELPDHLKPIPVGNPFHLVGIDILQLSLKEAGNKYAVVAMDYLTKWPEVFPVPGQTATTAAKVIVEGIICHHGVPEGLLSDRGSNFMSLNSSLRFVP